jgi:hypothetical protein
MVVVVTVIFVDCLRGWMVVDGGGWWMVIVEVEVDRVKVDVYGGCLRSPM